MDKSTLEKIIHRKANKIWEKEFNELHELLNNFFKNRPHFHEHSGWYRIVDPMDKFILSDKERVIKNLEEYELKSFIYEISRIQNYINEDEK